MTTVEEQIERCVALVPDHQKRKIRGALYQTHEICSDMGWMLACQIIPTLGSLTENDCHALAGMLGAHAGVAFSRDNLEILHSQVLTHVDQQLGN